VEDLEAESLQPRFTLTAANLREIANNEDFTPKSLDRNAIAKSKSRNKAGKTPLASVQRHFFREQKGSAAVGEFD
jgi:hypothetical protein